MSHTLDRSSETVTITLTEDQLCAFVMAHLTSHSLPNEHRLYVAALQGGNELLAAAKSVALADRADREKAGA